MEPAPQERQWFWATLTLSSVTVAAVVFAAWELIEYRFFRHSDYVTLHYLYITRGLASSLLLAFWAAWYVLRQRLRNEEELTLSRERYRGLLEASPGAVALYDGDLRVMEWNAAAERLYGFAKSEAIGRRLPTVPLEKEAELNELLGRTQHDEAVLNVETLRRNKEQTTFDVELSLIPFREAAGQRYFLEVSSDIRERVHLRQTLLEIEKLTSMGQMAAGTAHHLNTPLAAMLLRVQMMREKPADKIPASDLERLEAGLRFCQHFVQRLLEFSRPVPIRKQPERIDNAIESVLSFLAPSLMARRTRLVVNLAAGNDAHVIADRNQLEALFLTLLSNALDAIPVDGVIEITCRRPSNCAIEIEIADDGCGIAAADLARVFEPFFSTKGPGKGTGLGLAIARNIVREHSGSVRLESAPGEGTKAVVELPVCDGERPLPAAPLPSERIFA